MIGYVTLGTNDLKKAAAFYDKIAAEMGLTPSSTSSAATSTPSSAAKTKPSPPTAPPPQPTSPTKNPTLASRP